MSLSWPVWASLLRLLSLQPGPGLMKRKLCCNILQRKDRTFAGIEMCRRKGNKVLCKSERQIWRFKSRKWTWNLVDIFKGRLHNCTLYTKHTHTHTQHWGSCKGVWLLAFFSRRHKFHVSVIMTNHDSKAWIKTPTEPLEKSHLSCVCLCNLFFLPACRTCSLLLLLAPCQ